VEVLRYLWARGWVRQKRTEDVRDERHRGETTVRMRSEIWDLRTKIPDLNMTGISRLRFSALTSSVAVFSDLWSDDDGTT